MSNITVHTQAELDAALVSRVPGQRIIIDSPPADWLTVRESSRVEAWGSSSVVARDSSRVRAGKYVSVQRHPNRHGPLAEVTGGVLIDVPDLDEITDPAEWCAYHGLPIDDGKVILFKGVDDNYQSAYLTTYRPGSTVTAPDFTPTHDCGEGLHFSPSPQSTHAYCTPQRYLACEIELASMVCLGDKVKAPSCRVLCEVDRFGDRIEDDAAVSA